MLTSIIRPYYFATNAHSRTFRLVTSSSRISSGRISASTAAVASTPNTIPSPTAAEERNTGAFKNRLPNINAPESHFTRAKRFAYHTVKLDYTIKNVRNAHRKLAAVSLDTLMKALTIPLTKSLDAYKTTLRSLHPYEATVANLTVVARTKRGEPDLQVCFGDISEILYIIIIIYSFLMCSRSCKK